MTVGQNHGGPWEFAEEFMDGFLTANRHGMHWEYVETFLRDFRDTKDVGRSVLFALREWDLI